MNAAIRAVTQAILGLEPRVAANALVAPLRTRPGTGNTEEPAIAERCPRLVRTLDGEDAALAGAESLAGPRVEELRMRLATARADSRLTRAKASLPGVVFHLSSALMAIVADGALYVSRSADLAGVALGDLTMTGRDLATIVRVLALPVGFVVAGGFFAIKARMDEAEPRGRAVASVLLVALAGVGAWIRTPTSFAEGATYALLGIALPRAAADALRGLNGAMTSRGSARATRVTLEREVAECEERLQRTRQRRRQIANSLDADEEERLALRDGAPPERVRTAFGEARLASAITGSRGLILGVVAFAVAAAWVFAGCKPASTVPAAMSIVVDTSRSLPPEVREEGVLASFDAFSDLTGLPGGTVIQLLATRTESEVVTVLDEEVPRSWSPGAVSEERATFIDGLRRSMRTPSGLAPGDSDILRGLAVAGESLAQIDSDTKLIVLVSDLRQYHRGREFFEVAVPDPTSLIARLRDEHALPALDGVQVVACGTHLGPTERGRAWTLKDEVAVEAAFAAVVEATCGDFAVAPSCSAVALRRTLNTSLERKE